MPWKRAHCSKVYYQDRVPFWCANSQSPLFTEIKNIPIDSFHLWLEDKEGVRCLIACEAQHIPKIRGYYNVNEQFIVLKNIIGENSCFKFDDQKNFHEFTVNTTGTINLTFTMKNFREFSVYGNRKILFETTQKNYSDLVAIFARSKINLQETTKQNGELFDQ